MWTCFVVAILFSPFVFVEFSQQIQKKSILILRHFIFFFRHFQCQKSQQTGYNSCSLFISKFYVFNGKIVNLKRKKKLKKVHGLNEPISGRWTRQSPLKQFHFRTFQLIQELPKIASIVAENAGLRKRFCCENCGVSDSIDGKHSERNSRFDERRRTVRASRTHWQKMGVNQNHSSFVCAW